MRTSCSRYSSNAEHPNSCERQGDCRNHVGILQTSVGNARRPYVRPTLFSIHHSTDGRCRTCHPRRTRGRTSRAPCLWLGCIYRSGSPPRIASGRRQALGKTIRCRRSYGHDLSNHRLSLDLSGPGFDRCNDGGCALVFSPAGGDEPARPALVPEQAQVAAKSRARKLLE